MKEILSMSRKEIDRLAILNNVRNKLLTQVEAAKLLKISDRQVRNLLCSVKTNGPEGIVSKKRGKRSNNEYDDSTKQQVLKLVREHYDGFQPTLITEKLLENHQMEI